MLIDNSHCRWVLLTALIAVAALAIYLLCNAASPAGLTGGSGVGLWYGVIGSLLMIFAGLLSAHRRLARWPWLPRRSWMLKGHIWLGLLSFVFIVCHSGFRWGGTLERLLWVIFGLTLLSGIVGLALQRVLPRLITELVSEETPYEQMGHVRALILRRADEIVDGLCRPRHERKLAAVGAAAVEEQSGVAAELRRTYDDLIRPYLVGRSRVRSGRLVDAVAQLLTYPALDGAREPLQELQKLCARRKQIDQQETLHVWLHGWLLLHIPLSAALLVLGVAHAVASVYY